MIKKMNSWPNEKEYFDPGHYNFTHCGNCYQDNTSGSSTGSGWVMDLEYYYQNNINVKLQLYYMMILMVLVTKNLML